MKLADGRVDHHGLMVVRHAQHEMVQRCAVTFPRLHHDGVYSLLQQYAQNFRRKILTLVMGVTITNRATDTSGQVLS